MLRRTQDPLKREYVFDYRIITFFDSSFQMIRLTCSFVTPYRVSYNPNKQACWFGLFPFRSPLLRESIFLSLPPELCRYLPVPITRRLILQQARGQTFNRPSTACKLMVSCSISLPFWGSFHLSLAVLFRYRSRSSI